MSSSSRTASPPIDVAITDPAIVIVSGFNWIRSLSPIGPIVAFSILIALSNKIPEPSAGSILIPPDKV